MTHDLVRYGGAFLSLILLVNEEAAMMHDFIC